MLKHQVPKHLMLKERSRSGMIEVSIMNQAQVIFSGVAKSVVVPGDEGEFEVLAFHWPIVSLLRKGEIIVDNMGFPVSRGIVRFSGEKLVALVEL